MIVDAQTGDQLYFPDDDEQLALEEEEVSEAQLQEEAVSSGIEIDPAQTEHDNAVVSDVVKEALEWASTNGIVVSEKDRRSALGIFPKASCFISLEKTLNDPL
jgi:hypothetical protein